MGAVETLKSGEVFDLEGLRLKRAPGEIGPGDIYIAERNVGPKLLTCDYVKNNIVFPVEMAYPYDLWECVKVEEAD